MSPLTLLACNVAVSAPFTTVTQLAAYEPTSGPYVRISLRNPGVYRLTGAEMAAAGVRLDTVDPQAITLWNAGAQIPLRVESGSSSQFQREDIVEFVGEPPLSDKEGSAYFRPHDLYNVYHLSWQPIGEPIRYSAAPAIRTEAVSTGPPLFLRNLHLERDNIRFLLPVDQDDNDLLFWFCQLAGHVGSWPVRLDFPGFAPSPGRPPVMRVEMYGGTNVSGLTPQHSFNLHYGDDLVASPQFNGQARHVSTTTIPETLVAPNKEFKVSTPPGREGVVDSVFINSIELEYPYRPDADFQEYLRFSSVPVPGSSLPTHFPITNTLPGSIAYDVDRALMFSSSPEAPNVIGVRSGDRPTTYVVVASEGKLSADLVEFRNPRKSLHDLDSGTHQLIIDHRKVSRASSLYEKYRDSEGIPTSRVRTTDVYDQISHGMVDPNAIKQYINYARHRCAGLRYVLLFGDSTYDTREVYGFNNLNIPEVLVPMHWVSNDRVTYSAGYPDDNWYASFDNESVPDLAVGRVPVMNDQQGIDYLRKVIAHEQGESSAPAKALMISSVEKSFQDLVIQTQTKCAAAFTTISVLFPETGGDVAKEVERMENEINSGVQLLYYVGHGGAYVWRVGPSDFKAQKDLFTPANIKNLKNTGQYPIVLASSCYTTSFDNEESLGEAFLMEPDKGAIAVIGCPWKATVHESHSFNGSLIDEYLSSRSRRLGDAFLNSKRSALDGSGNVPFQTMTLLGDPALLIPRQQ